MRVITHLYAGFTLFETTIYVFLVSLLLTLVWPSILYSLQVMVWHLEASKAYGTTTFVEHKLQAALVGATQVRVSETALELDRSDLGAGSPLRFVVHDATLWLSRGTAAEQQLTDTGQANALPGTPLFRYNNALGELTVEYSVYKMPVKIVLYK